MGRGFIARAGVQAGSSHIRKKARATAASKGSVSVPDWTRLQGVGLRRFSQPPELVCGIFSGAYLNMPDLSAGPILCDPMDYSQPGSSVPGILQARILGWVVMPSSRGIFLTQGSNLCLLGLLHWQMVSFFFFFFLPLVPPRKPMECPNQ